MNEYRGKHAPTRPWPVASTASVKSRRGRHVKKSRRRRIRTLLFVMLMLALLIYPLIEARILTVDKQTYTFEDLPADANHLRVVYLSDIHWGFWYNDSDLNRLVSRINSLRPDLVLFGGDYATDSTTAVQFFGHLRKMGTIHARYGIYGVLGESDCGDSAFDRSELLDAMRNADVTPLVNQAASINIGSGRIWIAGSDDATGGNPDLKYIAGKVSSSDYVIFLAHNPALIQPAQQQTDKNGSFGWFDLGLFGHTHGGQMPLFSSWLGLGEDIPDRYQQGWKEENRSKLLISRGVGTSMLPCRLFCFPQIHCIELTTR